MFALSHTPLLRSGSSYLREEGGGEEEGEKKEKYIRQ
jgi:hypothetical protein